MQFLINIKEYYWKSCWVKSRILWFSLISTSSSKRSIFKTSHRIIIKLLLNDFKKFIIAFNEQIDLKLQEFISQLFQYSFSECTFEIGSFLCEIFIHNVMHLIVDLDDNCVIHENIYHEKMNYLIKKVLNDSVLMFVFETERRLFAICCCDV